MKRLFCSLVLLFVIGCKSTPTHTVVPADTSEVDAGNSVDAGDAGD
jgi:hypothetical protein